MNNGPIKYRIFTEQGCLTSEGIMKYLTEKISEKDTRIVQQHISDCDLCKEAVEGAGIFSDPAQYRRGIALLKYRWGRRNIHERKISRGTLVVITSVAASIILIVGIRMADRYQKKIRRQYMASVYQQGTTIDNALKTTDVLLIPINTENSTMTSRIEMAVREKYRQMLPELKEENIPVALLDETTISPNTNDFHTEVKEGSSPETIGKKTGILLYPYRVMSMPPPEKPSAGSKKSITEELFYAVEEMPQFQGKEMQMFSRHIQKNLLYPALALEKHISGRVYVQFTIDEKGRLRDGIILRSCHPLLDKEVLRVINDSPIWQPGKQRGKPVKVSMVMPVDFVLY